MRKLMGNQPLPLVCPRREPTCTKRNVVSQRSGADGQFALKTNNFTFRCKPPGLNQLRHTPIAQRPLQLRDRMESTWR